MTPIPFVTNQAVAMVEWTLLKRVFCLGLEAVSPFQGRPSQTTPACTSSRFDLWSVLRFNNVILKINRVIKRCDRIVALRLR